MKNSWILRIALIVSFTVIVIYFFPWKYSLSLDGVKFQLSAENEAVYKPLTITMDGRMYKNINGTKNFRGNLTIEGEIISESDIPRSVEISFDKDNYANLTFTTTFGCTFQYGDIFMNKSFDELFIRIYDEKDSGHTSWDRENGTVISAPASNREEAISIYNKLNIP